MELLKETNKGKYIKADIEKDTILMWAIYYLSGKEKRNIFMMVLIILFFPLIVIMDLAERLT